MAFTFVKHGSFDAAASTTTVAVTLATVTAGNLIAVYVKHEGATTTIAVSDGTSSLTAGTKITNTAGEPHGQWFYILASVASGSVTYTATFGAARTFRTIQAYEISYDDTAEFVDEAGAESNTGNPASGSMTTTEDNAVVFGGYSESSGAEVSLPLIFGVAADEDLILNGSGPGGNYTASWMRVLTAAATGSANCTITGTNNWVCVGIAFQETGGGGEEGRTTKNTRAYPHGINRGLFTRIHR